MGNPDPNLRKRLRDVELVALDVDGVLTDGRVLYVEDREAQAFNVQDGFGLRALALAGVRIAWISGRGCNATRRRAKELGVEELHLGVGPKAEVLAGVQARLEIGPERTAAMGDDLPDLAMRLRSNVFAAPADAHSEVRDRADFVTRARGGAGAVRELCEAVLEAKGLWADLVRSHGG